MTSHLRRLAFLLGSVWVVCAPNVEPQQIPIHDSAAFKVLSFEPGDGASVTRGAFQDIVVIGGLGAPNLDAVEYRAELSLNGHALQPFKYRMLPLTPTTTAEVAGAMTWVVYVAGPRQMHLSLRLVGDGFAFGKHYDFKQEDRTLRIICNRKTLPPIRVAQRLFHRCY